MVYGFFNIDFNAASLINRKNQLSKYYTQLLPINQESSLCRATH